MKVKEEKMAGKQPRPTGDGEGTTAPARPMAVREITIEDRIEALTLRVETLEDRISKHERYHFGKQG
jgi:hypothetical protein